MSVSIVTVATIKFSIESIVTIDTTVTELKKEYYETRENVDFIRFCFVQYLKMLDLRAFFVFYCLKNGH